MARKLKVYGGMLMNDDYKQERVVCAVHSQKELSKIVGESLYYIRDYWGVTGNAEEIKQALATPSQVIWMGRL